MKSPNWPGYTKIPLLALFVTALKQSRLPLEFFFRFMATANKKNFDFRTVYTSPAALEGSIDTVTLVSYLKVFFQTGSIVIDQTDRSWG